MKNKIKTTVVARTDERFVLAKNKGVERAPIFPEGGARIKCWTEPLFQVIRVD